MSWSWPYWIEADSGPVVVQSVTFPDRDTALAVAVAEYGWAALEDGTVKLVPETDPWGDR